MSELQRDMEEHFKHHQTMIKDFRHRSELSKALKDLEKTKEMKDERNKIIKEEGLIEDIYSLTNAMTTRKTVSATKENSWGRKKGITIKDNGKHLEVTEYNRNDRETASINKLVNYSEQVIEQGINGSNNEERREDFKQLMETTGETVDNGLARHYREGGKPQKLEEATKVDNDNGGRTRVKIFSTEPFNIDLRHYEDGESLEEQIDIRTTEQEEFEVLIHLTDSIQHVASEIREAEKQALQQVKELKETVDTMKARYMVAQQL